MIWLLLLAVLAAIAGAGVAFYYWAECRYLLTRNGEIYDELERTRDKLAHTKRELQEYAVVDWAGVDHYSRVVLAETRRAPEAPDWVRALDSWRVDPYHFLDAPLEGYDS